MPDWLFHWTHDDVFKEVLKVSIPALGSILAALIAWYGIRRTAKVTQEALENSKEATPPELLRLEKWSTILQESKGYPQEIKEGLDLAAIYSTYNDVLVRATLENRIMKLGILSAEVRQELLQISPGSGDGTYPNPAWKISKGGFKGIVILFAIVGFFGCTLVISVGNILKGDNSGWLTGSISLGIVVVAILGLLNLFILKKDSYYYKNDIYFRNSYRALKNIYLAPGVLDLSEDDGQKKQRNQFENHLGYNISYKKWKQKIEQEHPEWTSWNYGLSINWDNNPDKDKADGSESEEPTDLVSSESIPEDPERQES